MEKRTRRKYSPEFKREAVQLANNPGQSVAGVARDLGIKENLLRRWKKEIEEHGAQGFCQINYSRPQKLRILN